MTILKLSTKLDKFLTSWLVFILFQFCAVVVVSKTIDYGQFSHNPSDQNRTIQVATQNRKSDVKPTIINANNQTSQKTSTIYANHRMENGFEYSPSAHSNNKNTTSSQHQDRATSDSILRPQLALQIYTNSPSSSAQDDISPPTPSNHVFKSTGSTIIIPGRMNEEHQVAEQQNAYFEVPPSHRGSNSNRRDLSSRLNPWHYITERGPASSNNLVDSFPNVGVSTGNEASMAEQSSSSRSPGNSAQKPLINAIITVPAPNNDNHQSGNNNHADESAQNSTYTISRLLDDHSSDGIELSLNLNGDEIIINPVGKLSSSNKQGGFDNGDPDKQSNSGSQLQSGGYKRNRDHHETRRMSKALGKHVSSELTVDEQSASEIDMVDNNNNSDNNNNRNDEGEAGDPDAEFVNSQSSSRERDEGSSKARKDTSANDDDDNSNSNHPGRKDWRYQSRDYEDQANEGSDMQEADQHSQKTHRVSRAKVGHEERKGSSKQANNRSLIKSGSKNSYSKTNRKASGSKRRVAYKPDESELNVVENGDQPYSNRQGSSVAKASDSTASPVMISAEDVRRFEQLLENLRAITMNNDSYTAKPRRLGVSRATTKVSQRFTDRNQDNMNNDDVNMKNEDEMTPSTSHSAQEASGYGKQLNLPRTQSPSIRRPTQSELISTTDCDQRKKVQLEQQSLDRAATGGEPSIEPDSSPNIVDQDPIMSSGDGQDDLNDEGSDNSEQEEQGSVNHSKMSLPSSSVESSTEQESDTTKEDQSPPPLMRKTILQSYYDHERPPNDHRDETDLEAEHRLQHEASHAQHINENESQSDRERADHSSNQQVIQKNTPADDMSPINNYIDYNQLDDREVYRASRHAKADNHRVSRETGDPMNHDRFLQHVMEKAALLEEMRKAST